MCRAPISPRAENAQRLTDAPSPARVTWSTTISPERLAEVTEEFVAALNADLHCHTASDGLSRQGTWSPGAAANGVELWLTGITTTPVEGAPKAHAGHALRRRRGGVGELARATVILGPEDRPAVGFLALGLESIGQGRATRAQKSQMGRGRHPRQPRRCASLRRESRAHQPRALRAVSGRGRSRLRRGERVPEIPGEGPAGLGPAPVGGAPGRRGLDPRERRRRRRRPSRALQVRKAGDAGIFGFRTAAARASKS